MQKQLPCMSCEDRSASQNCTPHQAAARWLETGSSRLGFGTMHMLAQTACEYFKTLQNVDGSAYAMFRTC